MLLYLKLRGYQNEQNNAGLLEAGFVAGNMLMQATAMDLGCNFKTKLAGAEQQAIQNATGIPPSHIPLAIVSAGKIRAE